jgi:hypothetical protein
MNIFARLMKVDEARRTVIGRAIEEVVDKSDEIFDYATSKPFFEAWSKSFSDVTEGKSLGNLRAMHGKIAAGKLTGITFQDASKAIDIEAKVVDDAEWAKVLEGVYTGFSIGGKYVGDRKTEKVNEKDVKRYTADPAEISLVDNPCVPTSTFFQVIKADGTTAEKAFRPPALEVSGTDEDVAAFADLLRVSGKSVKDAVEILKRDFSQAERDKAADSGAAMPDGSFPIKSVADLHNAIRLAGNAKDPAAARAHIKSRAKALGAEDQIPDTWKLTDSTLVDAIEAAAQCADLQKRATDAATVVDLLKVSEGVLSDEERAVAKTTDDLRAAIIGKARMTQAHQDKIQAIHDHATSMGADCDGDTDKAHKAAPDAMLEKKLTEAMARIEKLESQPIPSITTLRMVAKPVTKEQDQKRNTVTVTDPNTVELLPADLIKNADGSVDTYMSRVMKARRLDQQARESASK